MIKKAIQGAVRAQKCAHAPYSRFKVGASVVTGSQIFSGCNIENASYGGTVCAERVAIWSAVAAKKKSFSDIVVVSNSQEPAPPCGLCLQVMAEFCAPATKIWLCRRGRLIKVLHLKDLLPHPFGPDFL